MSSRPHQAPQLPAEIATFLNEHHVLSLCTCGAGGIPYAANCYYVFLNVNETRPAPEDRSVGGDDNAHGPRFVFLSDRETRHGRELLTNPAAAGTVHIEPPAGPEGVASIRGVQFTGRAQMLDAADMSPLAKRAREAYYTKFEYARERPADFWILIVDYFKMTDNSVRFGFKRTWPEPAQ